MHSGLVLAALAVLGALSGCSHLGAHRTVSDADWQRNADAAGLPRDRIACPAITHRDKLIDGTVPDSCANRITETSPNYQINFAEFDDQGWLYPTNKALYGSASGQVDLLVKNVEEALIGPTDRVSVIVFAHGWKHSSLSTDTNVKAFRRILDDLGGVEKLSSSCPRKIIGVYIGWKGSIFEGDDNPLENISFWNRKDTAERVAQGEVRNLFARLRTLQDKANEKWNAAVNAERSLGTQDVDPCQRRMRVTYTGHSFGGLIIYTSLSQALIRDVAELSESEANAQNSSARPTPERDGDLTIVVNPAFEATRFAPLFNAAKRNRFAKYHMPMFISITSADDKATSTAFSYGRWLSTFNEQYPQGNDVNERYANKNTVGHTEAFRTHELLVLEDGEKDSTKCLDKAPATFEGSDFAARLINERQVLNEFRNSLRAVKFDGSMLKERYLCGGKTMKLIPTSTWAGNSPVWNVYTKNPIIKDHNDYENPLLLDVLRQFYLESDSIELKRELKSAEPVKP